MSFDRMAVVLSVAFPDRLRFFHDFLGLARGFVPVRRVLLVFALVMLLSWPLVILRSPSSWRTRDAVDGRTRFASSVDSPAGVFHHVVPGEDA
jgi:hypothetical protein